MLISKCVFTTAMEKTVEQSILQKEHNGCVIQRKSNSFMARYIHATNYLCNKCTDHEISSYQLFYRCAKFESKLQYRWLNTGTKIQCSLFYQRDLNHQ